MPRQLRKRNAKDVEDGAMVDSAPIVGICDKRGNFSIHPNLMVPFIRTNADKRAVAPKRGNVSSGAENDLETKRNNLSLKRGSDYEILSSDSLQSTKSQPFPNKRKFGIKIRPRSPERWEEVEVLWQKPEETQTFSLNSPFKKSNMSSFIYDDLVSSGSENDEVEVLFEGPNLSSRSSQGFSEETYNFCASST